MVFVNLLMWSLIWPAPAPAQIACTSLTSGFEDANQNSYTTASISPTANRLVLVAVGSVQTTDPPATPTISSYSEVATSSVAAASNYFRTTVFRSLSASPATGALTIDFGGATQIGGTWSVVECSNVDTSGTNGSGAIVQTKTDTAIDNTTLTITFDNPFGSVDNATYGAFSNNAAIAATEGSGFTELHDIQGASPNRSLFTEYKNSNDSTVDASNGSALTDWTGVAIEIKMATAASSGSRLLLLGVGP